VAQPSAHEQQLAARMAELERKIGQLTFVPTSFLSKTIRHSFKVD